VQFFGNTVPKNEINANFIDYLGFVIGLKYKTITKIANKIPQFPAEVIKHLGVFRSDCIIFSCILLISNSTCCMVSRAI
jgi:hypothetical protein